MSSGSPSHAGAVEEALRAATPAALAVVARASGNFADAEDAVQEAVLIALERWSLAMPERPVGWLVRVAERRLIARHRSDDARKRRESLVASWSSVPVEPAPSEDDSLALIFMCCHSALTPVAAIPLTLRAVGGLTTRAIAEALLVPEATVAQRISRAKAVVAASGEPFRLPAADLLDYRLPAVLQVIYLIYTDAHAGTGGVDLAGEAIRLGRVLHSRIPSHPEAAGLLALLLLSEARRHARTGTDGQLVPLDHQDRRLWDRAMISEGLRILTAALRLHAIGPYQLQAAIAGVHDEAPRYELTDWPRLLQLYDLLLAYNDNPVVVLNRAIAVAHTSGPSAALDELDSVAERLSGHHRFHATRGYVHELAGAGDLSADAYRRAADLATDGAERRYLLGKASDGRCGVASRVPLT